MVSREMVSSGMESMVSVPEDGLSRRRRASRRDDLPLENKMHISMIRRRAHALNQTLKGGQKIETYLPVRPQMPTFSPGFKSRVTPSRALMPPLSSYDASRSRMTMCPLSGQ